MQAAIRRILQGGGNTPSFDLPLTSSLVPARAGDYTPTFTRSSTAVVTDFEGLLKTVKSGEARFSGARRVENLNPQSEADSNWVAGGTTPPTVNTSVLYAGKTAVSTVFPAGVNGYGASRGTGSTFPIVFGRTYRTRFTIASDRPLIGTESIQIYATGDAGGVVVNLDASRNLSTAWATFSGTSIMGGTGVDYFTIFPSSNLSSPITIYLTERQMEDVTGQANQNPSEYVSTGVLSAPYHGAGVDGIKYFTYQNGNTVTNNVVNEAQGTAIPDATLKGYLAEGSRTNLLTYSEDFSNAAWAKNAATVTANAIASPSGTTTADKIISDTTSSNDHQVSQVFAVTNGTTYAVSIYAKKGEYSGLHLFFTGNCNTTSVLFDVNSGILVSGSGTITAQGNNGWYLLKVNITATADGSINFRPQIFPTTASIVSYTGDGTSGIYIWGAQIEPGSFASSYIPTTTAAVTRSADVLTYPTSGNLLSQSGSVYLETVSQNAPSSEGNRYYITPDSEVDSALLYWRTLYDNKLSIYDLITVATTNVPVMSASSNIQKLAAYWGNSRMSTCLNGLAGAGNPFDGDIGLGVNFRIGASTPFASAAFATIRNVKIWKKALSDTKLMEITR